MFGAMDLQENVYSIDATTRFVTEAKLKEKMAFCSTTVLDKNRGLIKIQEVRLLDKDTINKLKQQSCFDKFSFIFNKEFLSIDAFTGDILSSEPLNTITVMPTDELMRASVGNQHYPRTHRLKSYVITFGRVTAHLSVDPTYADINHIYFKIDAKDFKSCSGAIINKIQIPRSHN